MNELYEVKSHNEVISLPTITTNEIISAIVEKIARTVLKCLDQNKSLINDNTKYFITGGGLSYIKGAKDVVGRILDKSVEILSPPLPQLSKPQYSSMLSILYTAINRKNSKMKI